MRAKSRTAYRRDLVDQSKHEIGGGSLKQGVARLERDSASGREWLECLQTAKGRTRNEPTKRELAELRDESIRLAKTGGAQRPEIVRPLPARAIFRLGVANEKEWVRTSVLGRHA